MTERDSVTAAELDAIEARLRERPYRMLNFDRDTRAAANAIAALRRGRDEHANYCADALERLAAAEAALAKKDAALRAAFVWLEDDTPKWVKDQMNAALAPTAQGELPSGPCFMGGDFDVEIVQPAPAPSAGETVLVPRRLVADLAEELLSEVRARYGWPNVHPAMQRKFDNDMGSVNEALAALAPAAQGEYSPEQWTEYQRQHTAANPLNVARAAAPAPSAGETVREIVEHAIREKKRGLYSFAINYDRPGGPAIGFDGNTNEFYMALEELGLHHLETIRAALAAAPTTGETTND